MCRRRDKEIAQRKSPAMMLPGNLRGCRACLENVLQCELHVPVSRSRNTGVCRSGPGELAIRPSGERGRRIIRPEAVRHIVRFDSRLNPLAFTDPEIPRERRIPLPERWTDNVESAVIRS